MVVAHIGDPAAIMPVEPALKLAVTYRVAVAISAGSRLDIMA